MSAQALTVRPVRPDEAEMISDLALRSKAAWGYSEAFIEQCRDELRYTAEQIASERWSFVVAEDGEGILGLLALLQLAPNELPQQPEPDMELAGLFIEPDAMGKGVGRALMTVARDHARQYGALHLYIQSDPNAAGFYARMGAEVIGELPSGSIPGRCLPLMRLALDSA